MQLIKMKRVLACLLTGLMLVPVIGLTASSEDEDSSTTEASDSTDSTEETVDLEEEEEEFDVTLEEVTKYMTLIGEEDGYAVYVRSEDYKNEIEDEDVVKDLKDAEIVLVDSAKNQIVAACEKVGKTDDSIVYFSDAGRYLVYLSSDNSRIEKIRYRVSTLDSEYLFLTYDKQTLELYDEDYESVRVTLMLKDTDEDYANYYSEDGEYWGILSADQTQALACVKQVAENDTLVMYMDEDNAILALEYKESSYIWWSSPLGANRDTRATTTLAAELLSSVVLTYGNTSTRGTTNLRSANAATLNVKEITDGVEVTYKFSKADISVPVTYTLKDDYLEVSVDCSAIEEDVDSGLVATQITIMGSFGAGGPDEEGYFVIPDGCGAIINFNNGKDNTKSYSQKVYGKDITTVSTTKSAVTEEVYLPCYGIVKDGNAMTVIIEDGDGNATLNASVSGQSLSSYNICNYTFQLRGSDSYYMSGDSGSLTVFEDDIKTEKITLRYYPTAGDDVSYVDVAQTYQNYLLEDAGVTIKAEANTSELYVDLYGGVLKSQSILGIPITLKTSMTSYSEAKEIVSSLVDLGVDDMVVIYHNWTNAGISGKVDYKAKASSVLGGTSDFNSLTSYLDSQDIAFYPSVNNVTFKSGNGYYTFTDTTIRISGSYSRQMTYSLAYGVQDTSVKTKSLLTPSVFTEIYSKLASSYSSKGLTGVSLGDMTSTLYGDYGKQSMGRDDTLAALQESYQTMVDSGLSILGDSCAAYAFAYVDRISEVPLESSGFDVFDADIPFYQIVMHGIIPYSSTAINASADHTDTVLSAIAMGCDLAYDLIYADASDLKDTDFDVYFYAHYEYSLENAASEYALTKEILASVSDQTIVGYTKEDNVSITTYSDGTEIIVDFDADTITVGSKVYSLADEEGE